MLPVFCVAVLHCEDLHFSDNKARARQIILCLCNKQASEVLK